jgi:hypothetical protein
MYERLTPNKPQRIKWAGSSPAQGILAISCGLFQDDIESISNAADSGYHNPQHQVDPEILRDLITLVQIDGQRWDENCNDDF